MTIRPFPRLLAGPMDFTPGIFDIPRGGIALTRRVQTTLATQLAEYVVVYSPVQMAADLPENYLAHPDAFRVLIRDRTQIPVLTAPLLPGDHDIVADLGLQGFGRLPVGRHVLDASPARW